MDITRRRLLLLLGVGGSATIAWKEVVYDTQLRVGFGGRLIEPSESQNVSDNSPKTDKRYSRCDTEFDYLLLCSSPPYRTQVPYSTVKGLPKEFEIDLEYPPQKETKPEENTETKTEENTETKPENKNTSDSSSEDPPETPPDTDPTNPSSDPPSNSPSNPPDNDSPSNPPNNPPNTPPDNDFGVVGYGEGPYGG